MWGKCSTKVLSPCKVKFPTLSQRTRQGWGTLQGGYGAHGLWKKVVKTPLELNFR